MFALSEKTVIANYRFSTLHARDKKMLELGILQTIVHLLIIAI
jgi:hypothetical protein